MYYYRAFGLTISSHLNFKWPLPRIASPVDIACEIVQAAHPIEERGWDLFYSSAVITPGTSQPKVQIFSATRGLLLNYPDLACFEIQPDKIIYFLQGIPEQQVLESLLFRGALTLWLELIGIPVLHASGVVLRDRAVGFLANSARGKSTLAAGFVRGGARFLSDDIFPIELQACGYQAHPSYAWLRLLTEAAGALGFSSAVEGDADLEKAAIRLDENEGNFCPDPVPLAALYMPTRSEDTDTVSIRSLSSKQAYLGLLQHAFAGKWLVKSPLNAPRMVFFARLVKEVPIKELVYPSGYEHLPAVVKAVENDLHL